MKNQVSNWYAVLGDPVAHSKSPQIHAAFAQQTSIALHYTKEQIPAGEFEACVHKMVQHHLLGANVTVPYKFDAFNLATQKTQSALLAQAANTLTFQSGAIIADNTDGIGLVTDIETNAGFSLAGKRLLIIGAGGAVAGVLSAIIERKPACITLTNRSLEKAEALVNRFGHIDPKTPLSAKSLDQTATMDYECIVNGTSASLSGQRIHLPDRVFYNCPLVYDMMYGPSLFFLKQARESGAQTVRDGLGMLVEQAAASFYVWHGIKPNTQPVLETLRKTITA